MVQPVESYGKPLVCRRPPLVGRQCRDYWPYWLTADHAKIDRYGI
jgi:hypothetical protein